ncbi:MAG: hypothetical protein ACRD0G_13745 [Acidimicrobiales bacterium]
MVRRRGRNADDDIIDDATRVLSEGQPLIGLPIEPYPRWGTGLMLASELRPMLGETSFGHDGAAGGLCFADRENGVGFAYLPNQMGAILDPRANSIVDALRDCLR